MFSECEITIRSGVDNSSGVVTTPGFEEEGTYPPNTQCLFKFIAKKNERVKIDFIKFMVKGVMPGELSLAEPCRFSRKRNHSASVIVRRVMPGET